MQLLHSALQHGHSSAQRIAGRKLVFLGLSLTNGTLSLSTLSFLFATSQFNDSSLFGTKDRSISVEGFGREDFSKSRLAGLLDGDVEPVRLENPLLVRVDGLEGGGRGGEEKRDGCIFLPLGAGDPALDAQRHVI